MRKERYSERVQFWVDELARESRSPTPTARGGGGLRTVARPGVERRDGRRARIAEAPAFVPLPLWVVLVLGAALTIAFMCIQADRRERVVIQSVMIGFVTTLVTAGLLVVSSSTTRTPTRPGASSRPRCAGRSSSSTTGAPSRATSAASPVAPDRGEASG